MWIDAPEADSGSGMSYRNDVPKVKLVGYVAMEQKQGTSGCPWFERGGRAFQAFSYRLQIRVVQCQGRASID